MQQSTKIIRPATATIAVALAATATPLCAQDAAVVPPPVITTAPAPVPAPVAPVTVAPPPIARTVAPADPVASATDPTSRTTVNAGALAQAEAERPAPRRVAPAPTRAAPVERATVERIAPAPASAPAAPAVADRAPIAPAVKPAAPDAAMAQAMAPNEPASAEANPNGGIPISWLLGGLGALALLGVAAAMVLRRRGEAEYQEMHAHHELADEPVRPVVAHSTPVATTSPTLTSGPVRAEDGHLVGRHEALALRGRSENNPFLTVKNRLKRARFYDRQERLAGVAQRPASPFDPKPVVAAAATAVRDAGLVRARVRPARQSAFGWPGAAKPAMG